MFAAILRASSLLSSFAADANGQQLAYIYYESEPAWAARTMKQFGVSSAD